jgi:hypothetical protein
MSTFWQAVQRGARSAGPTPGPRRTGRRPPVGRGGPPTAARSIAPQGRTTPSSLLADCHVIQQERPQPFPGTSIPAAAAQRAAHGPYTASRLSVALQKS